MRELVFIQACPDDGFYMWQTHVWLESLRKIGHSDKAISLVFTPGDRKVKNEYWDNLVSLYPESTFFFQGDDDGISKFLPFYIPILRPYILSKYFKLHPELKEKAIFYCDADVVFTENLDIDKYLNDDINYLSNTLSYISADYFEKKTNDVTPSKLEQYKKRDVLSEACKIVGISKEKAVENNLNSGGAQYLLKNIDYTFWDKVFGDCLTIRQYLQTINRQYFESEAKGFQSWCCDMWSVLWNLWHRNQDTRIVEEMDFAWSTDDVEKLQKVGIMHNAGVVGKFHGETPMFFKGTYIQSENLFQDPHLDIVLNNKNNQKTCNNYYLKQIIETNSKYNIDYGLKPLK